MQHTQTECSRQVCWLPLNSITPRADRTFGQEDNRSIMELASSIQRWGLQNPITVQPQAPGRYVIVSGNRRYWACRMAGFTHMDAIILPVTGMGCTDQELLRCLNQGQMHYLEEADVLARLLENGMTREQLARCLGRTPSQIGQKLRLTSLDGALRSYLVEQNLSEGYARALAKLPDPAARMAIARQAVAQHLYVRDVEVLVAAAIARLPVPPPAGGKLISLMRDHRLYMNAIRAIVGQMEEAGLAPEVRQTRFGDYEEMTIRVQVRKRK